MAPAFAVVEFLEFVFSVTVEAVAVLAVLELREAVLLLHEQLSSSPDWRLIFDGNDNVNEDALFEPEELREAILLASCLFWDCCAALPLFFERGLVREKSIMIVW